LKNTFIPELGRVVLHTQSAQLPEVPGIQGNCKIHHPPLITALLWLRPAPSTCSPHPGPPTMAKMGRWSDNLKKVDLKKVDFFYSEFFDSGVFRLGVFQLEIFQLEIFQLEIF
jgi:hypothetical protein